MTPKLLGGPFLIQIYNIEPLLAWAIKTTKVNTVPGVVCKQLMLSTLLSTMNIQAILIKYTTFCFIVSVLL